MCVCVCVCVRHSKSVNSSSVDGALAFVLSFAEIILVIADILKGILTVLGL